MRTDVSGSDDGRAVVSSVVNGTHPGDDGTRKRLGRHGLDERVESRVTILFAGASNAAYGTKVEVFAVAAREKR